MSISTTMPQRATAPATGWLARLAAVLVISMVAWLGVSATSTARADSWTEIYRYNTLRGPVSIAACKEWVPSIYGPMWKVKVLYDRHSTGYGPAELLIQRPGTGETIHFLHSNSWWNGNLTIIESYASAWFDDRLGAYILIDGRWSGGYGTSGVSMSSIGTC